MWTQQKPGNIKLVLYLNDSEPERSKTFYSFAGEETKKGTEKTISGMVIRILQRLYFNRYKVAIFYNNGTEVERWESGIKK